MTNLNYFNPATNIYTGTSFADDIGTFELARAYPGRVGFEIYGMDGNDTIFSHIAGESRVDSLDGGSGDDFISAAATATNQATVGVFGGTGLDTFYLPDLRTAPAFTLNDRGTIITFDVYNEMDGSPLHVVLTVNVEIISFRGGVAEETIYYLTEDIANGRIRSVTFDEVFARAYQRPDWYIYGLDTYSDYHRTPGRVGAITSSSPRVFREGMTLTAGAVTGDPSGMPANPNYTYQWFKNNIPVQGATARSYFVPSGGFGTYRVAVSYTDAEGFRSTINTPNQVVGRILMGNSANNTLTGSIGSDLITGLGGADRITGGADKDIFRYTSLSESRLANLDRITDFAIGTDLLEAPRAMLRANVNQFGRASALTQKGISAVLTRTTFQPNRGATFTIGTGAGTRTFLCLNDGSAGFDANRDGLIEITGYSGRLGGLMLTPMI